MGLSRDKIKVRREAIGLTMDQAGTAYGFDKLPRQRWFALETRSRGNPSLDTLERMCAVLKCSILDILADDSPAFGNRRPTRRPTRQKRKTSSGSAGSIA